MHGKVLGTGMGLVPLRVIRSLQSAHDGHAHLSAQVGVFAIGLLPTSPARVTEDIHIGCPESKSLVAAVGTTLVEHTVFSTRFVGHGIEYLI